MAETLDSYNALKFTTPPSQSHESLPSPKLHSPIEEETEEALQDDTNYNQNNSVSLLKKLGCCFYGYEQDSEVDMENLKTAVIQDSPSGDVAYDAALVSTTSVVSEIQEPSSSCVVNFLDDGIGSRNEKNREEKFADDAIDSSTVKKEEGIFADYAIDSSTLKKQKGFFADYAIYPNTVKKQEDNFADEGINSRTLIKQEMNFSDHAIYSSTLKKQEGKFDGDGIDSRTVTKLEGKFSEDAIGSRTVKKQEKFESLIKCCLKIQVIDETALIESPCLGNRTFNNGKHQKPQVAKEKRPKRRVSKAAKRVETSGTRSQVCGFNGNKGKKRLLYSRKEMEALRFVGLEAQKNKWIEIYCGLCPLVAKEYDELSHHQKHNATGYDFDPRPQFLKASVPHRYLDAVAARRREGNHLKVSVR